MSDEKKEKLAFPMDEKIKREDVIISDSSLLDSVRETLKECEEAQKHCLDYKASVLAMAELKLIADELENRQKRLKERLLK